MKYILPTEPVAQELYFHTQDMCVKLNHQIHPFSPVQAFALVQAMVDDSVSKRLRWNRMPSNQTDTFLKAHWAWWSELLENDFSELFHHNILDNAFLSLEEMVDNLIPDDTWDIWYVSMYHRAVLLEKGQDFRIVDWEQRMQSGEWRRDGSDIRILTRRNSR